MKVTYSSGQKPKTILLKDVHVGSICKIVKLNPNGSYNPHDGKYIVKTYSNYVLLGQWKTTWEHSTLEYTEVELITEGSFMLEIENGQ